MRACFDVLRRCVERPKARLEGHETAGVACRGYSGGGECWEAAVWGCGGALPQVLGSRAGSPASPALAGGVAVPLDSRVTLQETLQAVLLHFALDVLSGTISWTSPISTIERLSRGRVAEQTLPGCVVCLEGLSLRRSAGCPIGRCVATPLTSLQPGVVPRAEFGWEASPKIRMNVMLMAVKRTVNHSRYHTLPE